MLEDIAILTGGTVLRRSWFELKDATIEALGQAAKFQSIKTVPSLSKVLVTQKRLLTVLRSSSHKSKQQPLNLTVKNCKNVWPNCLVVLPSQVGAATETELKEMKLRIEDALNDSRSRWRRNRCRRWYSSCQCYSAVAALGIREEMKRQDAISFFVLWKNRAPNCPQCRLRRIYCDWSFENAEVGTGFNAATGEWVNMIDAGIIDPVKVSRSALQNAPSGKSDFDNQTVVANKPEPAAPQDQMGSSMMRWDDVTWYQWVPKHHHAWCLAEVN